MAMLIAILLLHCFNIIGAACRSNWLHPYCPAATPASIWHTLACINVTYIISYVWCFCSSNKVMHAGGTGCTYSYVRRGLRTAPTPTTCVSERWMLPVLLIWQQPKQKRRATECYTHTHEPHSLLWYGYVVSQRVATRRGSLEWKLYCMQ